MFSRVQIVNIGLLKIGSSSITRLDPAVTPLEKHVVAGYDHWKRTELGKRRWVFATEFNYALAKTGTVSGAERPYIYELPTDCLRPVRDKTTEWVQRRGRTIHSAYDGLKIDYIANVDETEFDAMFVEVLACRVAQECVEFVTQSNTKKADTAALYKNAVDDAARNNAFVIGYEDNSSPDEHIPFITERL